jgi:hypothetical protein
MTFRLAWIMGLIALALVSCGPGGGMSDGGVAALPGTYENVTHILSTTCVFSSCHGGAGSGASMLNFQRSITNGTLMADLEQPSCQYSAMPLVTPGDPMNSWLYLKVAGPHMGQIIQFTPDPSWDHGGLMPDGTGRYPPSTCPFTVSGNIVFGTTMPMGTTTSFASQAETIRLWIAAGAPGP